MKIQQLRPVRSARAELARHAGVFLLAQTPAKRAAASRGSLAVRAERLAREVIRSRRLLLGTIVPVALAVAAGPAHAEYATLGATNRDQTVVGPVFAGSEVVWGEWTPARGGEAVTETEPVPALTPELAPAFSVLAAVPGSHGSTLFTVPDLSAGDELEPTGLIASPTQVAFAYEVDTFCGSGSLACSLPEELYADAFDSRLGGPFRRLAGGLGSVGSGPSGEEDGKAVAGAYDAESFGDSVQVTTLAGTPVYSVLVPLPEGDEQCWPGNGQGECGYALDADGTLAIVVHAGGGYALYWASPAQPQLHRIAVAAASAVIAIANDEIVYLAQAGVKSAQLALTDLGGNTRPISFPIDGGAAGVSGLAFDGSSVAWADGCIYGGSVPAGAPTSLPAPACQVVNVRSVNATIAGNGRVGIKLSCQYSPCSGSLTLTTAVKRMTGVGKHKSTKWTTVTIGAAKFTNLAVGSRDRVSLGLNPSGRQLLERSGHLHATLTAKVPAGSTSEKTSETILLRSKSAGRTTHAAGGF